MFLDDASVVALGKSFVRPNNGLPAWQRIKAEAKSELPAKPAI